MIARRTILALTAILVAACSSSSASDEGPSGSASDGGPSEPTTDAGSKGERPPNQSDATTPTGAPSIQCAATPCAGVAWALISDGGASKGWGSHAVLAGSKRFALVGAQNSAKLHGPQQSAQVQLAYASAVLLGLDANGTTKESIDLENVMLVGGLAASSDGRVAFVVSRGPLAKETKVASTSVPATESANVVVVLDTSGKVAWSATLGGTFNDTSLVFTPDGGLVFGGTKNDGFSTRPALRKWTSAGTDAWQSTMDTTPNTRAKVTGVALSSSGSVFVVGFHSGKLASVTIPDAASSFLLEVTSATGDIRWAKNLGDLTEAPSLAVVENDAVVASSGVARYAGGAVAPTSAAWTVALPEKTGVHALAADGDRIAVLGSLRGPTVFPFGTLGSATSGSSPAASLFVLDVTTQGKVEGGFSINPIADGRSPSMTAHGITTSGKSVVVSGTFTSKLDLGFGAISSDASAGQVVLELVRPK